MQSRFVELVLGVLLAVLIGHVLVIGQSVILPIAASLIVAYIVLGLSTLIARLPVLGPRLSVPIRSGLSIVIIGIALFSIVSMAVGSITEIVRAAPRYQDQLLGSIQMVASRLGVETEPSWQAIRDDVIGRINIQSLLGTALSSASALIGTFVIVMIYSTFLLVERGAFATKVSRLASDPAKLHRLRQVLADINSRIGTYLVTKTLINVLLAGVSYVIMRVAGIEFAGFWALLIGLFNYIPYVGSFVGVAFPVALSVAQFGAMGPVLGLLLALSAAQMTIGNFVEPWLMGNSLNLSPFVILVSLVAWSSIWGVPGAILSVPIMACLVIVLSEFEGTRPLAILLSRDGDVSPTHPDQA